MAIFDTGSDLGNWAIPFNTLLSGGPNATNPNPDLNSYGNMPQYSSLQDLLKNIPQFQAISGGHISAPTVSAQGSTYQASGPYKGDAYQAKDMSNFALPQYDAMRTRLNSQYSQVQGQAQDSLDRQFAAAGGGPGNGAQAKQTENLAAGIAQQKGNDLQGINAQEAQTRFGLQQQEAERAFQSGEAQKGYGFQAAQSELGRQFAGGESAAGRNQASQIFNAQSGLQSQMFNTQQATDAQKFNAQMQQNQNQFNFGANTTLAGLNQAYQTAQQQGAIDLFNAQMSQYQAQHSGGLLGGGGFLGTGFL